MQAFREKPTVVSCRLEGVILLDKKGSNIFAYQGEPFCCGSKGVFPTWTGERSVCKGPENCSLLEEKVLFYPPDKSIWLPVLDKDCWEQLKAMFLKVADYTLPDNVKEHIIEVQRKWGI